MATFEKDTQEIESGELKSSGIQLSEIINWTFTHKLFIAISVIACLALGIFYAKHSQPIYERSSSVMLRTDANGQSQISELAAFSDLGIGGTNIDVYNEMQAFQSPVLMLDVVNRLKLNVTYSNKNWIGRINDLYTNSPLSAEFSNIPEKYDGKKLRRFSFLTEKRADGKIDISEFRINNKEIDAEMTATLGKPFKTPAGTIVLHATNFYNSNFEKPVTVSYALPEVTAKSNSARLSVNLADKNSTVINFSYTDPSAKRAEDVLQTLLAAYNDEWKRYTSESTLNTAKFINERLTVIEKELSSVDENIAKFKSDNQLLDINAETMQVTSESSKYSDLTFQTSNQLAVARFIREYLTDKTKEYDLLPSNSGIESQSIESQIAEYNKLLLDRQRLAAGSSDNNPLVADLNEQLKMLHSAIQKSVDNHISSLEIQLARLTDQEMSIANRISSSPEKAKDLISIERQQQIKGELYLYLLQKREENELQASITVNNTRLIKPATGNDAPVSPKTAIIYMASLILGLAIPYGYMFLSGMFNTTVRNRKDIEGLTAPFIGEIPQIGKPQRLNSFRKKFFQKEVEDAAPKIVVESHNRDAANEAFRAARTNLDFMIGNNNQTETILITSYFPGSGKSFISANMATAAALKGKKVAVIDLDIRKGTFSKLVHSPRKGVCTYLNGLCSLDEIIVDGANSGLPFDTIPTGQLPPNPAELLLSERLDEIAAELKKRYDYIYLDCAPALAVTDTNIISRIADRTMFVIRVRLMDRRILPEVERLYHEGIYKNFAIILNGCENTSGKYGKYSNYGYGYGYGYGSTSSFSGVGGGVQKKTESQRKSSKTRWKIVEVDDE